MQRGKLFACFAFSTFLVMATGLTVSDVDPLTLLADEPAQTWLSSVFRYVRVSAILTLLWFLPLVTRGLRRNSGMAAAVLYFFASSLWSENPFGTFSSALNILLWAGLCIVATRKLGVALSINVFWAVVTALVVMSVGLAASGSSYALTDSEPQLWRGLFGSKNGMGAVCGVLILSTFVLRPVRAVPATVRALVLAVAGIGLLRSNSVGPLLATAIGLSSAGGLSVLRKYQNRKRTAYPVIMGLLLLGATLVATVIPNVIELLGRDLTFTGRTTLWAAVLPASLDPIGHGFGTVGEVAGSALAQTLGATSKAVDNAYIALAIELGWPFVAVYVAWLARLSVSPAMRSQEVGSYAVTAAATFMLSYGLVEKGGGPYLGIAFSLLILLRCAADPGSSSRTPNQDNTVMYHAKK